MLSPKALEVFRNDYSIFIEQVIGESTLEEYQKRIIRAVVAHDRVAVRATHAVGKSYISARIVLSIGSLYQGAKIITTAPTHRQVEKILWGEINTAYKKSKFPLGGKILSTAWKIADDWFAIGFSPKKDAEGGQGQTGSTFQGFHARVIFIVFDEATGIPSDVWKQVEGLLTSGEIVKFLAIGNPTTKNCDFYKCFSDPLFHKEVISCFDSPNLIANGISSMEEMKREIDFLKSLPDDAKLKRFQAYKLVSPYLLRCDWAVATVLKLGFDHPLVMSKVFGDFPDEDSNALISLGHVEAAIQRNYMIEIDREERFIGVDVARFGTDKTVITELVGFKMTRVKVITKFDTMAVVGEIVSMIQSENSLSPTTVLVDGTGIGAGVVDRLKEVMKERRWAVDVLEIHNANRATDPEHYANIKAEMFEKMADDIKTKLGILEESAFLEELPSILHGFNSKGLLVVESKEDYKKRTGRESPDHADSLALANWGRYAMARPAAFPKQKELVKTTIKVVEY